MIKLKRMVRDFVNCERGEGATTQVALVAIAAVVMVGLFTVYNTQVKPWAEKSVKEVITQTGGTAESTPALGQ